MIRKELFGKLPTGEEVYAYTLSNGSIATPTFLNYGGILQKLIMKNNFGIPADIVCGFDTIEGYLQSEGYQGALIGRVANRIGDAKFTLDGVEYNLAKNNIGRHSIHGGNVGFNARIWDVEEIDGKEPTLVLTLFSPDGEENYPGNLSVKVTYTLTTKGFLSMHYEAESDKPTIINMTHHAYFNMSGYNGGVIDDHTLWLEADRINSLDKDLIPDGKLIDVKGTVYDFNKDRRIGDGFSDDSPMMREFCGYDNNFVLSGYDGTVRRVACLRDPHSVRRISLYTDAPCVQVYTANMINTTDPAFKKGIPQYKHCAVCLETGKMPDAINHEGFTDITLRPGEKYDTTTIFRLENW